MPVSDRGRRKMLTGTVISDRMDKTVVVAVERKVIHPLYKKTLTRTSRHFAHDEKNECQVGDVVEIIESRPLSRLKRWRVRRIVRKARVPRVRRREVVPEEELVLESLEQGATDEGAREGDKETEDTTDFQEKEGLSSDAGS